MGIWYVTATRKLRADPKYRYLYEINAFTDLEDVCEVNFLAVETLDNEEQVIDIAASTLSQQASMYKSTGKV